MKATIKVRGLRNGDEAHRVEFEDGTRAHFYFSGGQVAITDPQGESRIETWDLDTDPTEYSEALQLEYARIDQASTATAEWSGVEYLEMNDTEYNEWAAAVRPFTI